VLWRHIPTCCECAWLAVQEGTGDTKKRELLKNPTKIEEIKKKY